MSLAQLIGGLLAMARHCRQATSGGGEFCYLVIDLVSAPPPPGVHRSIGQIALTTATNAPLPLPPRTPIAIGVRKSMPAKGLEER